MGDDPLSSSAQLAGPSEHDMSYPTYGQLVTPTRDLQHQQQATAAGQVAGGSAVSTEGPAETAAPAASDSTVTDSSSNPLDAQQQGRQAAAAEPHATAAVYSAPPEPQDSMGSIPSPHAPQQPSVELPLVVSVSDPLRREAPGMLGMKGGRRGRSCCMRCLRKLLCQCIAAHPAADSNACWVESVNSYGVLSVIAVFEYPYILRCIALAGQPRVFSTASGLWGPGLRAHARACLCCRAAACCCQPRTSSTWSAAAAACRAGHSPRCRCGAALMTLWGWRSCSR